MEEAEAASVINELEVLDPLVAGLKASHQLLQEELVHRFCINLCKSGLLVVVEWIKLKRYIQSYHKLKISLGFLDYMKESIGGLDDSVEKTEYLKDLKYLGISILENLVLVSKNTKFESDIPNWYKDLLDLKLDVEGDKNGILAALYMEVSVFYLKRSNFSESIKFCQLSHNIYSSSSSSFWLNNHSFELSLDYPFQFYLSQRLLYIISCLWNPTENPLPHNPFDYMLKKFYLTSEWVEIEFAFLDFLGPQPLSTSILDELLKKTLGLTGFRIQILMKKAQVLCGTWESDTQEAKYSEIVYLLDDMIQYPEHLIDLLEDLTGVLVELRGNMKMEPLTTILIRWLNSVPHLGHRGRIKLMVGRLLLLKSETRIEGDLYLDCAQLDLISGYGENNPFLNIISDEREKAKVQYNLQEDVNVVVDDAQIDEWVINNMG